MAFQIETGFVQIEARGVDETSRKVDGLGRTTRKTGDELKRAGGRARDARGRFIKLGDSAAGTEKRMLSLGAAFAGVFAGTALIAGLRKSIALFREQELVEAKLESQVRATGMAAGFTAEQLKRQASALQEVTLFGDETTIAAQGVLLSFRNIQGVNFERTIESAQDLATLLDGNLNAAVIQLGKALNDPIANLSALSRSGIQFSKEQKARIKQLVEENQLFKAQGEILDELDKQFGGLAKAAADTKLGKLQQASNSIGDSLERLGKVAAGPAASALNALAGAAESLADGLASIPKLLPRFPDMPEFRGHERQRETAEEARQRRRNNERIFQQIKERQRLERENEEKVRSENRSRAREQIRSRVVGTLRQVDVLGGLNNLLEGFNAFSRTTSAVAALNRGEGVGLAPSLQAKVDAAFEAPERKKRLNALRERREQLLQQREQTINPPEVFSSNRMGLGDIGEQIQAAALARDDTEKRILEENQRQTERLDRQIQLLEQQDNVMRLGPL